MSAYYNEFDPGAAAWLRELIKRGVIAPGDVDERSIEDVRPADLVGYTQCHFFAGIGIWSAALRAAGWEDDRPVWTGSCPCQPFSQAGKGAGVDDPRHLWPAWWWLLQHGKDPAVPILGEQVASQDGLAWLDIVQADLEAASYTVRAVDLCAAGFGAPHIRQRIFFHASRVANADGAGPQGRERRPAPAQRQATERGGEVGGLGHTDGLGAGRITGEGGGAEAGEGGRGCGDHAQPPSNPGGLANPGHDERSGRDTVRTADGEHDGQASPREGAGAEGKRTEHDPAVRSTGSGVADTFSQRSDRGRSGEASYGGYPIEPERLRDARSERPGPTNGFWRAADWLYGKDEKWRPVEPGTFPLAHGSAARMVRLRGYGNAINKEVATAFIKEVM